MYVLRLCGLLLLSATVVFGQNTGARGGSGLIQPLADLQKELKGKLERITVHGKSLEDNLEGNSADRVKRNTYSLKSSSIIGYARI